MKAKQTLKAGKVSRRFTNVWLLTRDTGRCPAEEFLAALQDDELTKMVVVLKRVDDDPSYRHEERFKVLNEPVFEFKTHRYRLLCFKTSRGFVCTEGMKKQKPSRTRVSDAAVDATEKLAKLFAKKGTYDEQQG